MVYIKKMSLLKKTILHLGNKRKCYEKRLNLQQNLSVFKNMIAKIKNTIDCLRKENHSEKKKLEFLNRQDKIGDIKNQSGKTRM